MGAGSTAADGNGVRRGGQGWASCLGQFWELWSPLGHCQVKAPSGEASESQTQLVLPGLVKPMNAQRQTREWLVQVLFELGKVTHLPGPQVPPL